MTTERYLFTKQRQQNHVGNGTASKTKSKNRRSSFSFFPWLLLLFVVVCVLVIALSTDDIKVWLHETGQKLIAKTNLLKSVIVGVGMTTFTFMITYLDSSCPGISPPTPLSPRKMRERSGHTFHLNYTMAFINGITLFGISIWKNWETS